MADVFISYHIKSALETARKISGRLAERGISCWYSETGIRGGEDFAKTVPPQIETCKVFLLIVDKGAVQSNHVGNELGLAFKRVNQIAIIPFQTEECDLTYWTKYYLVHIQIMKPDSTLSMDDRIEKLVSRVEEAVGEYRRAEALRMESERSVFRKEGRRKKEYTAQKSWEEAKRKAKEKAQRRKREETARNAWEKAVRKAQKREECRKQEDAKTRGNLEFPSRAKAIREKLEKHTTTKTIAAGYDFSAAVRGDSILLMTLPLLSVLYSWVALILLIVPPVECGIIAFFCEFWTWFLEWNWKLNIEHILLTVLGVIGILFIVAKWAVILRTCYVEVEQQFFAYEQTATIRKKCNQQKQNKIVQSIFTSIFSKTFVVVFTDGTVFAAGNRKYNVSDWQNISAVSVGSFHIVGLCLDGTVVAIGSNDCGQCNVSDWRDIVAISAGNNFTVGLRSDGTVVAVGDNRSGQCNVSDWREIVEISAMTNHAVGLHSDGTVVAVGSNGCGQCNISKWQNISAISAGDGFTIGLRSNGMVASVGNNKHGQCNVSDWRDIVEISAGRYHTIGLRKDGTMVATGSNDDGQCNVTRWRNIRLPEPRPLPPLPAEEKTVPETENL